MSEIRNKIKEYFKESKRTIIAHSRDESMSLTEKRENIELEEDHFIDQILSIPELAVVDREAELPKIIEQKPKLGTIAETLYLKQEVKLQKKAQQDMLKAGWVKEIKDGS